MITSDCWTLGEWALLWCAAYLTTGGVWGGVVVETELLLPFFRIGGLFVLSLLDEDRLFGSLFSMSCTFLLMQAASGQCCKRGEGGGGGRESMEKITFVRSYVAYKGSIQKRFS